MKITPELLAVEFGNADTQLFRQTHDNKLPLDFQHERVQFAIGNDITLQQLSDKLNELIETPSSLVISEQTILKYLDNAIDMWRKKVLLYSDGNNNKLMAQCYVDAFQSVRISLFGELKKPEYVELSTT
jgi:hypothetical protein